MRSTRKRCPCNPLLRPSYWICQLKQLLRGAGLSPQEALRTNEGAYRQHVAGKNLSDDELLQIMAEYPELLQRPIVVRGNKAVLARPVDKLTELGIK
jgi:arsenate reductase